ncbi:hypothetical protein ABW20_dc0107061 [Dactylellina cionopaga]|nr:hypothetical protein ABW20_dc0107061 [Dactylellina cionopaga]
MIHVQPKPPPKPTSSHKAITTSSSPTSPSPPTLEKSTDKKLKQTLHGFEKQLRPKSAKIDSIEEQKTLLAGKEAIAKVRPTPLFEEPEGFLALYEETPAICDSPNDLGFDQCDDSRANLVRLCKIAYEKGKEDKMTDYRKQMKEEGYREGLKEGQKDGREEGWKEGYREGYDEGYMMGREYGDKKITKEINETIAELTKDPNALLMSGSKAPASLNSIDKSILGMI